MEVIERIVYSVGRILEHRYLQSIPPMLWPIKLISRPALPSQSGMQKRNINPHLLLQKSMQNMRPFLDTRAGRDGRKERFDSSCFEGFSDPSPI
jgi:hypothetical protein